MVWNRAFFLSVVMVSGAAAAAAQSPPQQDDRRESRDGLSSLNDCLAKVSLGDSKAVDDCVRDNVGEIASHLGAPGAQGLPDRRDTSQADRDKPRQQTAGSRKTPASF